MNIFHSSLYICQNADKISVPSPYSHLCSLTKSQDMIFQIQLLVLRAGHEHLMIFRGVIMIMTPNAPSVYEYEFAF